MIHGFSISHLEFHPIEEAGSPHYERPEAVNPILGEATIVTYDHRAGHEALRYGWNAGS